MAYITNKDKMLQAVLYNKRLMEFGGYTPSEVNTIYDAHIKERAINPTYEGIVDSCGLLFKKGEIVKKVAEDKIVEELLDLIHNS